MAIVLQHDRGRLHRAAISRWTARSLAFRKVSRDLGCRETIRLKDGRTITAVDIQREFLDLAHRYYRDREHEPWVRRACWRAGSTMLDRLAEDPMQPRPRARLGDQAPAHRELHGQARPRVDGLPRADDRPAVPRHPAGQGPLLQARGVGRGRAAGDRRRDRQGDLRSAQGHPGLLPRACACSATPTRSSPPPGTR